MPQNPGHTPSQPMPVPANILARSFRATDRPIEMLQQLQIDIRFLRGITPPGVRRDHLDSSLKGLELAISHLQVAAVSV